MLENFHCLTCGMTVPSNAHYHFHNVSTHTVDELSATILKFLLQAEESLLISPKLVEDLKFSNKNQKNDVKKSTGGFLRECMDEVIELGPIEGADNLTVQSLFLKSNFTPNSRHIIEVEEKKHSQDVIRVLSEELNAAVVHFQKDFLSVGIPRCPEREFQRPQGKNYETDSNTLFPKRKSKKKTRKGVLSSWNKKKLCRTTSTSQTSKDDTGLHSNSIEVKTKKGKTKDEKDRSIKPNFTLVLRSGRAIKTNPKYEDFVYYDDYKETFQKSGCVNSQRFHGTSKNIVKSTTKKNGKSASAERLPQQSLNQNDINRPFSFEPLSSRNLDLLADDLNLGDWSFNNELDISIEDLDLSGFDDLEGTLPENQILTIENLLQELDGGGSIEISNIIRENNIDSDTVILDALSQSGNGLHKDSLQDLNQLVSGFNTLQGTALKRKSGSEDCIKRNYCDICSKQYINRSHFLSHREKCHVKPNKILYKCTTCDRVFVFLAAFEKHIKEHDPNQTFLCELCGRNFKGLVNLNIHFALHKKEKIYQCHLCSKKYFLKYSYLSHLKTHSTEGKYHCEKCRKTFTQKLHFNKHLEKHKSGKFLGWSEDYKCNHCCDIKSSKDLSTFSKCERSFVTCLKCKKGLYKKYLLKNESYTNFEETEVQTRKDCKICGKHVKHLKKHIRETHLSNPVVQCDVCNQSIKKSSLSAHKHRAHSGVASKCDHCNKIFKNTLALKEHTNKIKKVK